MTKAKPEWAIEYDGKGGWWVMRGGVVVAGHYPTEAVARTELTMRASAFLVLKQKVVNNEKVC